MKQIIDGIEVVDHLENKEYKNKHVFNLLYRKWLLIAAISLAILFSIITVFNVLQLVFTNNLFDKVYDKFGFHVGFGSEYQPYTLLWVSSILFFPLILLFFSISMRWKFSKGIFEFLIFMYVCFLIVCIIFSVCLNDNEMLFKDFYYYGGPINVPDETWLQVDKYMVASDELEIDKALMYSEISIISLSIILGIGMTLNNYLKNRKK